MTHLKYTCLLVYTVIAVFMRANCRQQFWRKIEEKLRIAHAPGMPGTFSLPPTSKGTVS